MAFDIPGFGRREPYARKYIRDAMYDIVENAFSDSQLDWPPAWIEDRGDGLLIAMSLDLPPQHAIDPLVHYLTAGLKRHNRVSKEAVQMTLRMAVHAGTIWRDSRGLAGEAVDLLFRLLDAPSFKEDIESANATLGLVVSQEFYDTVVRLGLGLVDPDAYSKLPVMIKETITEAWIHLRQHP